MGGGFKTRKIPRELLLDPPPRRWRWGVWLAFGLVFVVAALFAVSASAELPDAGTGDLLFRDNGGYRPAVLLNTAYHTVVNGVVASTTLTQSFRNDSNDWREAVYVFPLPETAALHAMSIRVGDRVIVAVIKRREAAQKIYMAARKAGKVAALTEQQRPNLFTQSIANIGPGVRVKITLRFIQVVDYRDGRFQLRLPLTLTPRYIPGIPSDQTTHSSADIGWAEPTGQVPDASHITPYMTPAPRPGSHTASITVALDAGVALQSVESPYHRIDTRERRDGAVVTLADGSVAMDRDFVLKWRPTVADRPRAVFFGEHQGGSDYGLLMVMPPTGGRTIALPREFIFVIDISGSMKGMSIRQARGALKDALARLGYEDLFDIIAFNSGCRSLFGVPRYASQANIDAASDFVDGLSASGGTEMACALKAALSRRAPERYLKQMVFITDGAVGNEAALFRMIARGIGTSRLFTVGIGSAPNSYFMRKAAQFGRGTFTHIGSSTEVGHKIKALFDKIESPVARFIAVDWQGSSDVESFPSRIPALYAGEPLVVFVRGSDLQGAAEIVGQSRNRGWDESVPVEVNGDDNGIDVLWARAKIGSLLDEKAMGAANAHIKEDVTRLGLVHRLVTPFTSFVSVEHYVSRLPGDPVVRDAVPSQIAEGQQVAAFMMPTTGTHSRLAFLLGVIAVTLAAALGWRSARQS